MEDPEFSLPSSSGSSKQQEQQNVLIAECIYLVTVGSRHLIMDANFPESFIPRAFGESGNDNLPFLGDRGILKQPKTLENRFLGFPMASLHLIITNRDANSNSLAIFIPWGFGAKIYKPRVIM